MPTDATRLAEARRDVHETLTSLPAWDADTARQRIAALEQEVRDQALAEAAEIASTVIGPLWHLDTLHEICDRLQAAHTAPSA
jgi:hypothetical protein